MFTDIVWECLWQRSAELAKLKLYTTYTNGNTLSKRFTQIKQECMLHCEEHIPILEEAKQHASPADRQFLEELKQKSMFDVVEMQREARR
jgi:hypothetical protein